MQTWAWLAKCHTEVYLASVFVTDVARTGNDENLRHRYSTCSECFPLNVPAHRNESGYLRTSSKTVSIATLHQPTSPYLRPPSPGGEGTRRGGLRGAGLRLPSPGGRRCRAAADEGHSCRRDCSLIRLQGLHSLLVGAEYLGDSFNNSL